MGLLKRIIIKCRQFRYALRVIYKNYKEGSMSELYQLHWEFKDGTTEMKAQRELNSFEERRIWLKEVKKDHPLPKGAIWMMCTSKSEHFERSSK